MPLPQFLFRTTRAWSRHAPGIAAEFLFWFALPLAFLADYVFLWYRPAVAAGEHLCFVALGVASVVLARTVLLRRAPRRWARLLASAIAGAALFVMLSYYVLVILVLRAWGRVVTVEVIENYAGKANALCETLGVGLPLALALLAALFLLCWTAADVGLRRFFWQPPAGKPSGLGDALLLSLFVLTSYHLIDFPLSSSRAFEPVTLTLWSGKAGAGRDYTQGKTVPAVYTERERAAQADYQPASLRRRPNLVLIVVDGLRYDHMGVNGYSRATTPFLSELSRQRKLGVSPAIRASCGETTCGLSSLAASRYSHDMPDHPFALAKVAKRNGYRVEMIMGDRHPDPDLLYGSVDAYYDGRHATGYYLDDDTFILDKTAALAPWDGRPLMLQYHLMAAHTLGRKHRQYWKYLPAAPYAGVTRGAPDQRFTNYYDAGVLQTDAEIATLLGQLKTKGYLRDALVVITSDHGEALGEHGNFAHARSVHEELLHIPLFTLRYRGGVEQAPLRFAQFGSQIDIAPTILHELRLPIPTTWSGAPLQLARAAPFTYFQMVPFLGLYDHRDGTHLWKFFIDLNRQEEFAYDLSVDPGERNNLAATAPRALLQEWRARIKSVDRGIAMQMRPSA